MDPVKGLIRQDNSPNFYCQEIPNCLFPGGRLVPGILGPWVLGLFLGEYDMKLDDCSDPLS